MGEMLRSGSALLGFNFNTREANATHAPSAAAAAAVEDHIPPVVNAGLARPQPDPYSNSSLDQEVNAGAGLPQSGCGDGGDALTEEPEWGSCRRIKLACDSSSQRSAWEFDWESLCFVTEIKPPSGSTDSEIISFLKREESSITVPLSPPLSPHVMGVNLRLGEQDQIAPKAVRSYVTTVEMMPDRKTHLGYWKEKERTKFLRDDQGLKRTFQFHRYDGTKTNWFMHEYVLLDYWGSDLFMKDLRFREVYEGEVPVPGDPTSPEVKIKKIAAAKIHRMRGPKDLVIEGESPAWQHFIKIYDRHPELKGSKVVYAVCCHCGVVLKAGTENGTKSLLAHCDRTCPVKNKKQQPSSSSSNSTGDTSCPSTAADTRSSSPDLEVNTGPGLPQSGGGALTEAPVPVWGSGERKKVVCGSSSQQRSTPEFNSGLVQSDPSYSDSKPPTGSTDPEIIDFLRREQVHGKEVNRSRAEQDQSDPRASRSYLTTVEMIPDHGSHLGYWEEKEIVHGSERRGTSWPDAYYQYHGLKVTFQFHSYTAHILSGLAFLHKRKHIHRDIKGANILVGSNNEVKLADFGLAKHIATLTEVHTSCRGTPCWMAPEVILSNCSGKGHNLSADIWSVGCTVIEMAKGKPPLHGYEPVPAMFKIANDDTYIPEIPDVLSDEGKIFLQLCLQRTPASRPSAAQLTDHPFIQNQGS